MLAARTLAPIVPEIIAWPPRPSGRRRAHGPNHYRRTS
jgi:hypothetical protein